MEPVSYWSYIIEVVHSCYLCDEVLSQVLNPEHITLRLHNKYVHE
jgi:hypothetical protein